MEHRPAARLVWPPSPGHFKLRLVSKGWPVPAQILHANNIWSAILDGTAHPPHPDPAHAPQVDRIWSSGIIIEAWEYQWLLALKDAARVSQPDHPCLWPRQPIRPALLRPILPPPKERHR